MSKSLLSDEKVCFVCGTPLVIHKHHIYPGSRRQTSEREGCWVYLCGMHHNLSSQGVHNNPELDRRLKRLCQEKWEAKHGTTEDFIRVFGKSYK